MEITRTRLEGVPVLAPTGRIDSFSARAFETEVMEEAGSGGPLIIDFAGLAYISSAGLRVLLLAMKAMRASGQRLVLAGLQPAVQEVFDVSGFSGIFEIRPTAADAAAAIRSG
jgi:anti-anti-sigma factor